MEIKVLKKVLAAQELDAENNRKLFAEKKVVAINLMSSPGSGKTTLLEKTIEALGKKIRFAVIEGDIRTTMDAQRLARFDIPIVQINTDPFGGECHLEPNWVRTAVESFDLNDIDVLFVENVGNLVCPAEFDLGVDFNVVLISVTEGEDKPAKYPLMFQVCHLCLITKIDILNVLDYDMDKTENNLRSANSNLKTMKISAKTGKGMDKWFDFIHEQIEKKKNEKLG